jgi:hypothetical protein
VAGISGCAPAIGLEICVCRQRVLPPISHKSPLSIAMPSRQTVLIALLKYQDLCPAGTPIRRSASDVRRKKIGSNFSDHLFGPLGAATNRDEETSRDNSALSSPMSLISFFLLLNVRNPEARRN